MTWLTALDLVVDATLVNHGQASTRNADHPPRHRRRERLTSAGVRRAEGAQAGSSADGAVRVDGQDLGRTKAADAQVVTLDHHVAQIRIELEPADRVAADGGEADELAARACHVNQVALRVVGETARRCAHLAALQDGPRHGIDGHDGTAAAQGNCDASGRIRDHPPRLVARLQRDRGRHLEIIQIHEVDSVAIRVSCHRHQIAWKHHQGAAGDGGGGLGQNAGRGNEGGRLTAEASHGHTWEGGEGRSQSAVQPRAEVAKASHAVAGRGVGRGGSGGLRRSCRCLRSGGGGSRGACRARAAADRCLAASVRGGQCDEKESLCGAHRRRTWSRHHAPPRSCGHEGQAGWQTRKLALANSIV